jgi:hypothetical protein
MKRLKTVTLITILFGIVVFIFTILDFAALHDIKQDYVSRNILHYLRINLSSDLPDWTSTEGEWRIVALSFCLRSLYFIFNTALLVYLYRGVVNRNERK